MKLFSCNVNSVWGARKRFALHHALSVHGYPDLICLQETKLDAAFSSAELRLPLHNVFRADRSSAGGGVLVAVSSAVSARRLRYALPQGRSEAVLVSVSGLLPRSLVVGSIYSPDHRDGSIFELLAYFLPRIAGLPCILGGDFNTPDLFMDDENNLCPRSARSIRLFSTFEDYGFVVSITPPTRLDKRLDLLVSRGVHLSETSTGAMVSDHKSIVARVSVDELPRSPHRPIRLWHRAAPDVIAAKLHSLLHPIPSGSVSEMWDVFESAFGAAAELVPLSVRRPHGHHAFPLPRETVRLIRRKRRKLIAWRRFQSPADLMQLKVLTKSVRFAVGSACKQFFTNLAEGPVKKVWDYTRRLRKSSSIPTLDGNIALDCDKAAAFNAFFASVYTQEDSSGPTPPFRRLTQSETPRISVSVDGVARLCSALKTSSASGPDGIPAVFLKSFAGSIAPFLAALFQRSFDSGCVPAPWKISTIVPVHKHGERGVAGNYRPISLTSLVCKLAEHIICSAVMDYLDRESLLSPFQHGFRKKHSTQSQLIYVMHSLHDAKVSDVVSFDFRKAFDVVPHRRLLTKLAGFGLAPTLLRWVTCFLSGRSQRVRVGSSLSPPAAVASGVPQGSVIGPLLFLLYINDIPDCIGPGTHIALYADDTLLFRPIVCSADSVALQDDIDRIFAWSMKWLMPFNLSKCHSIRIKAAASPGSPSASEYTLALGSHRISSVDELLYLGFVLTHNLKLRAQTVRLAGKARAALGVLVRNFSLCPRHLKLQLYCSLVRPVLEYAAAATGPSLVADIARLEMVQRRAVRFITGHLRTLDPPVTALMHGLGLVSLEARRRQLRFTVMTNIASGRLCVPFGRVALLPAGRRADAEFVNRTLTETSPAVRACFLARLAVVARRSLAPNSLWDSALLMGLPALPPVPASVHVS